MAEAGWNVSVTGALRAHFKQPAGPSRAGADWSVSLVGDGAQHRVMVRTYADDFGSLAEADEARVVVAYVGQLIESGWTPDQYTGKPGELVVPREMPLPPGVQPGSKRPWWRFW